MILVDTSVWIDHLRKPVEGLVSALESDAVLSHPWIIGELACGNLGRARTEMLSLLHELPSAPVASEAEALSFIEHHRLAGSGVGYLDVHLLASVVLAGDAKLWTRDRRLAEVAERLSVCWN